LSGGSVRRIIDLCSISWSRSEHHEMMPNTARGRVKTPGQRADGRLGGWKFYSFGVSRWSETDGVTR
jgi:hypothetical protein